MRHAVNLPPFGPLADPSAVLDVAAAAEEHGWDGLFLWDHVLRPEPLAVADPWILLAAIATTTTRLRIGPMVTPVTRRRIGKLARETVTLDHLSAGRLTLGLGLGSERAREHAAFGDPVDPVLRAHGLDEGADLLVRLWSGERVHHHGFFTVDDVQLLPGPVQQPRIPLWFAAHGPSMRPVRRAARYDGLYPVGVGREQLAAMVDVVRAERGGLDGFDVAATPGPELGLDVLAALGVTWAVRLPEPGIGPDAVIALLAAGPEAV